MSVNAKEASNEHDIKEAGLNKPRITPDHITKVVERVDYYRFPETTTTVCCMTLKNGFTVVGHSACASPENFNADLGRKFAADDARRQIWAFEGYLLRQRLHLEETVLGEYRND